MRGWRCAPWPSTCGGDTGIELVRFVLFSDETYGHFADALATLAAS